MQLDEKWHKKFDAPGTGRKVPGKDGMDANIETEIIDERKDKSKPLAAVSEAAALSRKEKTSMLQFPNDEKEVLERPTQKKETQPRVRGAEYYKRKNQSRRERAKEEKRQRVSKWDKEEDDDNETEDKDISSFGASPDGSSGEPHVLEKRDGWRRIEVNLDTGAAATAIPADLDLSGHRKSPPQDVNYKTASAECLADEGGVVLKGTDVLGTAKVLEGRVTGVHRTLASGAKVAQHHYLALGAKGGQLIPKNSQAGKEYEEFMKKLYKKHSYLTPVTVRNGIYMMDFWIAPGSSESFPGHPDRV